MTKFFNKFKKLPFLVHFPNFWGKIFFPENPPLSHKTSYWFLAPCQNLENSNQKRLDKPKDGRKDGRMDRPYFIGPFWLPPGVHKEKVKYVALMVFQACKLTTYKVLTYGPN